MAERPPEGPRGGSIERTSPRAVFAEWIAAALGRAPVRPTPMAVAYLVELLDARVRARAPGPDGEASLAEALLTARLEQGAARIRRLRDLGDRALFVAGFFGDSLARSAVDLAYYGDAGRAAYANLAAELAARRRDASWSRLYQELAGRFGDFVELLAEVSDRAFAAHSSSLLGLYDRYLQTGSARDRRRLLRRGCVPALRPGPRRWQ